MVKEGKAVSEDKRKRPITNKIQIQFPPGKFMGIFSNFWLAKIPRLRKYKVTYVLGTVLNMFITICKRDVTGVVYCVYAYGV